MKKLISILIVIPVTLALGWYLWPEVTLSSISFPNDLDNIAEEFGVNWFDACTGRNEKGVFCYIDLGTRRILWLENKRDSEKTILSADILYYFKGSLAERVVRKLNYVAIPLHKVEESASDQEAGSVQETPVE